MHWFKFGGQRSKVKVSGMLSNCNWTGQQRHKTTTTILVLDEGDVFKSLVLFLTDCLKPSNVFYHVGQRKEARNNKCLKNDQ